MIDKNGRARCDECGQYVSCKDVESGAASYSAGITGDMLCNTWEYYDCLCPKHNTKAKDQPNE
jgi:hypothetical protein